MLCLKSSKYCKIKTKEFTPDFVTVWEEINRLLFLEGQKWPGPVHLWKYKQTNFSTQTIVSIIDWLSDVLLIPLYIVHV